MTWTQHWSSGISLMRTVNSLITAAISGFVLTGALLSIASVSAETAAGTEDLSETIQYLLEFVKTSECRFYRNNKAHTPEEAVAHMKRKYAHFKDKIKTPEDFIRLAATKSLISGQSYSVILKDGKKITSEAWLLQALDDYRQQNK